MKVLNKWKWLSEPFCIRIPFRLSSLLFFLPGRQNRMRPLNKEHRYTEYLFLCVANSFREYCDLLCLCSSKNMHHSWREGIPNVNINWADFCHRKHQDDTRAPVGSFEQYCGVFMCTLCSVHYIMYITQYTMYEYSICKVYMGMYIVQYICSSPFCR